MLKPAVLWLHGLGDTGAGWKGAFGPLAKQADFHHPTAPEQPVTSPVHQGEVMTSWFDIQGWPLGLSEPEGPPGIEETVTVIHQKLDSIAESGVPHDKIVLGGFSQGGAVSILAGLTYPKRLAGIVAISGWCVYREQLAERVHEANRHTPIFLSVGIGDPIVTFPLTKASGELLQKTLGDHVIANHADRPMHPPEHGELMGAAQFIKAQLGI